MIGDRFRMASDLELPDTLADLCDETPPEKFREDVSSSELRANAKRHESDP
jgi:hypothetical protein